MLNILYVKHNTHQCKLFIKCVENNTKNDKKFVTKPILLCEEIIIY